MAIMEITTDNFATEVKGSKKPVLVEFWAVWCGPCRMFAPVMEKIAEEDDRFKVCKLNVDNEPVISEQYSIMTIPTVIMFKDGKPVSKSIGVRTKEDLYSVLGIEG